MACKHHQIDRELVHAGLLRIWACRCRTCLREWLEVQGHA